MPAITIRDVPAGVRNELAARAARNGQSLQQYLLRELEAIAETPDRATVLERIRRRTARTQTRLSATEVVEMLSDDRENGY